jgi:EAL domain-containing protein (putative c-di-GMP-specific phosphodiesterase class I)
MAFQPIVDTDSETVYAYEALVRGLKGEPASSIMCQVNESNRYAFDQGCRVQAITQASRLGLAQTGAKLSINFMPGAVYSPVACIQLTLRTARECGFPCDRLIFEFTEAERVVDVPHLRTIIAEYRRQGFRIALDDFGAGFSGLNLLAELPPNIIKLDMDLIRDLERRPAARCIVRFMVELARTLGSDLIAEGVETVAEYAALRECGVSLMQGYLLARPAFEVLPAFSMPAAGMYAVQPSASYTELQGLATA